MADIAASDVTVTVQDRWIEGPAKYTRVKIEFGDGALTYDSTGGVPLPTYPDFGFKRNIDQLVLFDTDDESGIIWKYDQEGHLLRGYLQGLTVEAAASATLDDFALDQTADPLASAISVGLDNAAGAGTHYLGEMKELVNDAVLEAQTLYAVCRGW